jgi:hypothetical protein
MELGGRGKGLNDVATIEGSPKTTVGRALGGHERMFARAASDRKSPGSREAIRLGSSSPSRGWL